jgi:hypothetical protein
VQVLSIATLNPTSPRLNGATVGEVHADQIRKIISAATLKDGEVVVLDFARVESASASYLKRILNPFFAEVGSFDGFPQAVSPVVMNVDSADLLEDLEAYVAGKDRVMLIAELAEPGLKFRKLLGRLDGAASETFAELQRLKETTASQLYAMHPERTTNQTAWNNRLVQLVELRVANRRREGRIWIYQPTIS